jgi:hypothetical protein
MGLCRLCLENDHVGISALLTLISDYASRLIGAERGLCRCCGRAHAIQHDADCPVPYLMRRIAEARRNYDEQGGAA